MECCDGQCSCVEKVVLLEAETKTLRHQLQVVTVGLSLILDHLEKNGETPIINTNSIYYKAIHETPSWEMDNIKWSLRQPTGMGMESAPAQTGTLPVKPMSSQIEVTHIDFSDEDDDYTESSNRVTEVLPRLPTSSSEPALVTVTGEVQAGKMPNDSQLENAFSLNKVIERLIPNDTLHNSAQRTESKAPRTFGKRQIKTPRIEPATVELHKKNKQYNQRCQYCKKKFATSSGKKLHERIHTGEKPYKCGFCAAAFSAQTSIIRHERIHTGEKPYNCSFCNLSFNQLDSKVKHERVHTGEKPYPCKFCEKMFADHSNLARHQRRTHLNER